MFYFLLPFTALLVLADVKFLTCVRFNFISSWGLMSSFFTKKNVMAGVMLGVWDDISVACIVVDALVCSFLSII